MSKQSTFVGIMAFYAVLTYLIFPLVSYYAFQRSLESAGYGFVAGSIFSLFLWFAFGRAIVQG